MKNKLVLIVTTIYLLVTAFVQLQNGYANEKPGDAVHQRAEAN